MSVGGEGEAARLHHRAFCPSLSTARFFLLGLPGLLCVSVCATSRTPKSVLLLVAGQTGIPEVDAAVAGARSILQSDTSFSLTIYTEYLDEDRFSPDYLKRLPDWYREKYEEHQPDLIIAGGASALDFLLHSRHNLWPNVPVVFSAADERILRPALLGKQVTGILFGQDIKRSLEQALRLLPDTEGVALIGGATPEDRFGRDIFRREVGRLGNRLTFFDLTGLPMDALKNWVTSLPKRTIVFYLPMYIDGAGQAFLPSEVLSTLAAQSKCPIFGLDEPFLGHGLLGGWLASYQEMGRQVALLALRILRGESASAIPIQRSAASVLAFDWRQLQKWDIDESRLDPGAIVRNREISTWDQHRWLILAVLTVCVIQTSLITGLLYQRRQRRRVTESLDERLRFETLVADLSAILSNPPISDMDHQFRDCLERIARFLQADRGSLWRRTGDKGNWTVAHSWWAEGVNPPPLSISADNFPAIGEALKRGVVVISKLDELSAEADLDRQVIGRFGARSLAVAPLAVAGKIIGVLVFVRTHRESAWPAGLAQRLQTLAEIFANALARNESESAVRQSEELNSAVLASLEEYVTVLDRAGVIIRTSPTPPIRVSDNGSGPLIQMPAVGRNYLKLWRLVTTSDVNSDAAPMIEAIERVLQERQPVAVVEYHDPLVPEGRWLEVRVQRLDRPQGGAVITHLDITSRKRAEIEARRNLDEIAHMNRVAAMGELATSLAHEINQPLTAILSNAQAACRFLSGKSSDLAEVGECLTDIIADDKRAGEVIKRLRVLLKKGEFQASVVDLNEVVRDVIRLVGHDALLRKVSVVFEPLPGLPPVLGDRIQLYQVALNLIVNGLAAAAEQVERDRWLLVRTAEPDSDGVELAVEDSGKGIANEDLPRVFEPFFTTKQEGLGMGLSISRSIVQAHGGWLRAENSAGGGAIFRCVLPVAQRGAMVSAP